MKKALTIAGCDPSGGAGIQADLKVFHALGVYGLSVVSSLTAQSTQGVESVLPVHGKFVRRQLAVLLSDMLPDATKTGMLFTEENVEVVAYIVRKYSLRNLVVDPVMLSSTGKKLAGKGMADALRSKLLPLCTLVTPNMHEAAVLTGLEVKNIEDMKEAGSCLRDMGCENVIVTGGHLKDNAVDVLYDGDFHYFRTRKKRGEFHGTGCSFSSAVTSFLAQGRSVVDSAGMAKKFMLRALSGALRPGRGMRLLQI